MTTVINDRRNEPVRHKFGKDQARFMRRIRDAVKQAVQDKVTGSTIKDFGKGGVKVPVPKKVTQTPVIQHGQGPVFKKVFPGNLYGVGDIVPVPAGGGGRGGSEASPDAEDDNDDFVWVSEDEFLDIFFEGRSLPDMSKLSDMGNSVTEKKRSGYMSKGPSHKMDMDQTNQKRKNEALVLNKVSERQLLSNLLEQYNIYRPYKQDLPEITLKGKGKKDQLEAVTGVLNTLQTQFEISAGEIYKNPTLTILFNCIDSLAENLDIDAMQPDDAKRLKTLQNRVPAQIKASRKAQRFQNHHQTYHHDDDVPKPSAKAVMFCKMDVSGSMGQEEKNNAKAFFSLINQFLEAKYDETEIVFISHTTTAFEVDEEEFFYGTRSGGTIVSSCLEKELEIIQERYPPSEWNIYSAQASDGDNYDKDNQNVLKLMQEILPMQQASYFIETPNSWRRGNGYSSLHKLYMRIAEEFPNLKTAQVNSPGEAIDAFNRFFPVGGTVPVNEPTMG